MRLWSLDPNMLDAKGLVALWREGLLAQKVLAGKTKGYRYHPQLERFRSTKDPLRTIGLYLQAVCDEADARSYQFDRSKILKRKNGRGHFMSVTRGQLKFEFEHLKVKLQKRDKNKLMEISKIKKVRALRGIRVVRGALESWERP